MSLWSLKLKANVVKLVDTPDLGSGAARFESSSLSVRTKCKRYTGGFNTLSELARFNGNVCEDA